MLENEIELYFIDSILQIGGYPIKINTLSSRGFPDRMILLEGKIIFVELKAPEGKLSSFQRYIHEKIRKYKLEVYVISSKEEVDKLCTNLI